MVRTVRPPARAESPGETAGGNSAPTLGAPAPAIRLRGLDERWVALEQFRGQDTLVLFWNPGCGFCQRMRDDVKAWEARQVPGKPLLLSGLDGRR